MSGLWIAVPRLTAYISFCPLSSGGPAGGPRFGSVEMSADNYRATAHYQAFTRCYMQFLVG